MIAYWQLIALDITKGRAMLAREGWGVVADTGGENFSNGGIFARRAVRAIAQDGTHF